MGSTFDKEKLFSNEVKEEIVDSEVSGTQLTDGNFEKFPVQEKEAESSPAFNAHAFLSNEEGKKIDLVKEEVEDDDFEYVNWRVNDVNGDEDGQNRPDSPSFMGMCHTRRDASVDGAAEETLKDGKIVDRDDFMNHDEKACPVDGCTETLPSTEDLVEHMRIHSGPWLCGICKRSCAYASDLRTHYITHTGEKPFKCDICEGTFTQQSTLNLHLRRHKGERPFECDSCDFKTIRSVDLKRHMLIHTGERPYPCTICGKRFNLSSTLAGHMRVHTGERPFKCEHCEFATSDRTSLKRHNRTHSGEKPHSCTICDRSFRNIPSLTSHMRRHTGERPYECDICEYKAIDAYSLKKHKRTHTGEKPYSCTCGFKTSGWSSLNRHKKSFSH